MRVKDKVAFITGGGGEIARAIAHEFLQNGASILLFDRDQELLDRAISQLSSFGDRVQAFAGDVCKFNDLEQAVDLCVKKFGKIDILITCVGIAKHLPIDEMSEESWQSVLNVNLTGTYLACKAVIPEMKKNNYGRIVNISSLGGRTGRPNVGVNYAASKAGIIGLTMALARELGPWGITVNAIAPGPVEGPFNKDMPPDKVAMLKAGVCIDRFGSNQDVAYAALYLGSNEASWVTGEVLDVNGGLYM
ncbi:SDR family NAD(P)-dependent oxidoreductase [Brevibacillus sp. TJ4]|uniref:SDR family NAD(P)-dependent oxidoreductase n=1 Tax=Brevibacillus sp. TJ4 TaxID=3234853 RepID=UPI0037D65ECB